MPSTAYKPAGHTVFPRHDDPSAPCVLAALLEREPWRDQLAWPEGFAGGIAHRLDTHTSGALWVADDPGELKRMRALFAAGALTKRYVFLTDGAVSWTESTVEHRIAHDRRRKRRMVVERGRNTAHRGRWYDAHTRFRHLDGPLWEAVITTGVTHQIRVHAAFVGLGLRGDPLYGKGEAPYFLHHLGLDGPLGATEPVPLPPWAQPFRSIVTGA